MQEAYSRLGEMSDKYLEDYKHNHSPYTDGVATGIDYAIQIIESLIEKEKEVMCEFVDKYRDDSCYTSFSGDITSEETTEEFFNKTFNIKDK